MEDDWRGKIHHSAVWRGKGRLPVAALRSLEHWALVLDNKEQANFYQSLIDYCLFIATGVESGRSSGMDNFARAAHLAQSW
jgi:hypothetical protein